MAHFLAVSVALNLALLAAWARQGARARFCRAELAQARRAHGGAVRVARLAAGELRGQALALAGRGESSGRLLTLAESLIEQTQAPGQVRLEAAPVAVGELLDFAVAQVTADLAPGQRAWRLAPDLAERRVLADRRALHQVLVRVLSAAALATREGDWIDVAAVPCASGWTLAIEDEGLGLPITETEAGGPESRGLGLGLTLARELMQAHGGALLLESAQGVGTRALLVFPAERVLDETSA